MPLFSELRLKSSGRGFSFCIANFYINFEPQSTFKFNIKEEQ